MDREQHVVQDAAEHYAVYVMQRRAEELGRAKARASDRLWSEFAAYVDRGGFTLSDFETGPYAKYKANADLQLPAFVDRLSALSTGATLDFENVEKEFRNRGMKADFLIHSSGRPEPIAVSLKNYIGSGGITRPQVASGTFASFAASFIFDRIGVGRYADPRNSTEAFQGRDVEARNSVLEHMGRKDLADHLAVLDRLQAEVRAEFLSDECEFYDRARVRAAAERVSKEGIETVLTLFELIGIDDVRERFLERIGLDGKEEALFFDETRYVDSITNRRYHDLREELNSEDTDFTVSKYRQNIRFSFERNGSVLLATDVPFTINTNGAWYRPKERYEGTEVYIDKGHPVELRWGQRRPYKSKEIATSVNTYINLAKVGIFGN